MLFQTSSPRFSMLGQGQPSSTLAALPADASAEVRARYGELKRQEVRVREGIAAFTENTLRRMDVAHDPSPTWVGGSATINQGLIDDLNAQFVQQRLPYKITVDPVIVPGTPPIVGRVTLLGVVLVAQLRVLLLAINAQLASIERDTAAANAFRAAADAAIREAAKAAIDEGSKPTPIYKEPWFWVTVLGSVAVLGGGYVLMQRRYAPRAI